MTAPDTEGTASAQPETPYDFLQAWGLENVPGGGWFASDAVLYEIHHALHAVDEFLLEPLHNKLKEIIDASDEADCDERGRLAESERHLFTLEDVGRLVRFTDNMRGDCDYLQDRLGEIVVDLHDELSNIANGWPRQSTPDPEYRATLRRLHGVA